MSCVCFQGASARFEPQVVQPQPAVPRRWQSGIHQLTKMMNLKKLKRRLSLTFKGRGLDNSLSDLAEQMTIEDSNGITKESNQGTIDKLCVSDLSQYVH